MWYFLVELLGKTSLAEFQRLMAIVVVEYILPKAAVKRED